MAISVSNDPLVPVAGSNFARADVVVEGRRLGANVQISAIVNGREACTRLHVVEKPPPSVPLDFKLCAEDFGYYRAKWADYEGQPNLLLISTLHDSVKRYLGPGPEYYGQNSPVFRLLLAEIVAESVCRRLLALHAKNHPAEFRLAELGDDQAIVDQVLLELHRRMRDFVAQAHTVMLSAQEIGESQ